MTRKSDWAIPTTLLAVMAVLVLGQAALQGAADTAVDAPMFEVFV